MSLTKVPQNLITGGALTSKTANYTVVDADTFINVDATSGNLTMTLPAAGTREGVSFTFRKSDTSANIIDLGGVIDLTNPEQVMSLISDGTNWVVTNITTPNVYSVHTDGIVPTGTLGAAYNVSIFGTMTGNDYTLYNTSTGVFTSPKAGNLDCKAIVNCAFTSGTAKSVLVRFLNVTQTKFITAQVFSSGATAGLRCHCSGVLKVAKGDTVEVQTYCDGASPIYSVAQSSFSINYQGD